MFVFQKTIPLIFEHRSKDSEVDLVAKMQGNIDTTNISRIEAGKINPTIYSLYGLSEALETSMSELVKLDLEK